MKRIEKIVGPGQAVAKPLLRRAATLTLPFEERSRSRLAAALDDGTEVALFLPRGTVLRDGDVLVAEDGSLVRVAAAAQPVLRATAPDPHLLLRAAYHLGNRHTPVEVGASYLQLEPDPVLQDLLRRLGLTVETVQAPFEPEAGAYGGGHKHGHDATFAEDYALAQGAFHARHGDGDAGHHGCGHDHAEEHAQDESHAGIHAHDHDHRHGHAHGHGHAHDHAHRPGQAHGHTHEHAHEHGCQHGSGDAHEHQHGHQHGHGHAHGQGTKASVTRDRN